LPRFTSLTISHRDSHLYSHRPPPGCAAIAARFVLDFALPPRYARIRATRRADRDRPTAAAAHRPVAQAGSTRWKEGRRWQWQTWKRQKWVTVPNGVKLSPKRNQRRELSKWRKRAKTGTGSRFVESAEQTRCLSPALAGSPFRRHRAEILLDCEARYW